MPTSLPVPSPPGPLLDALLRQAPLDVLLFDAALVCRYAALAGDRLLGRTEHEIIGLNAAALFGDRDAPLLSALRRAAAAAERVAYPDLRMTDGDGETRTHRCWAVGIEPVTLLDYRGGDEFRGVLVTLADVADLADERDRLRGAEARLIAEVADLRVRLDARGERAAAARQAVRDALAPVSGYLQVLARRPELLAGRDLGALAAELLPRLAAAVAAADEVADGPGPGPGGPTGASPD